MPPPPSASAPIAFRKSVASANGAKWSEITQIAAGKQVGNHPPPHRNSGERPGNPGERLGNSGQCSRNSGQHAGILGQHAGNRGKCPGIHGNAPGQRRNTLGFRGKAWESGGTLWENAATPQDFGGMPWEFAGTGRDSAAKAAGPARRGSSTFAQRSHTGRARNISVTFSRTSPPLPSASAPAIFHKSAGCRYAPFRS